MSVSGGTASDRDQNRSVLDEYSNKVFKLVVLIVPIFFMCGNGTMTVLHYMGMYPAVSDVAMWCSNAVDICYMIISICLVKTSYGPDGRLIPKNLPIAKIVLMAMVVIQWNLNSYICPFTDFWAYAPLFVIVQAFFFDVKFVSLSTALILVSMVISWIINGENLLPVRNEFFTLNLMFRGICLAFTLLSINIITWFGKVFIIEAVSSREKEREIRLKRDEYEREAQMKSDFLANMSHEIRTPMNAVIGMAEIAMREELPPAAMDCLTQIQKSGRSLLNIINDILDYSKIDSGKMEIVEERYEPSSELNDISNILATRIGSKELELYLVADTGTPRALLGDPMRIRQILINLVNNAIKFTNEGRVGVIVSCTYTGEDTIDLTFHIKDTGIGIKKENMEKLFVSFQQVDSRRNRAVEGTGLGLAISQRLVEAMGGTIGVESEYGKGSDFWFTIPQKVLDPSPYASVRDTGWKRAIFLDKDSNSAHAFTEVMNRLGVYTMSIPNLNAYQRASGHRDYLFLEYGHYNNIVRKFFEMNPTLTGIVLVDYNSDFKPECDNIHTMRRPLSTIKVVRTLNDEEEEKLVFEEKAFSVTFTAPEANILIVDDNKINISIAKGLLAPMNMNIDSALSGREAIEMIAEKDYDIVLMDHMMPEMDGVDTTKIIREKNKNDDDPVIIALTANAVKEARDMFLESGMNDFVAKPIDVKELVSKIRKWLPEEKINKNAQESEEVHQETSEMTASKPASPAPAAPKADPSDPLAALSMLDTDYAIELLGTPDILMDIVEEYYESGRETYDGIMESYENEDTENYTIRVHALKSSSRQVGALEVGDKAEALEKAGNNNDWDYIKANNEDTLNTFMELLDQLKPVIAP